MVLSRDPGLMLLLLKPSHPSFLPLVECTKVGLPHPFGKLRQGEFGLLHVDWGFAFGPAQVQRIIAIIICPEFAVANLCSCGQIRIGCNCLVGRLMKGLAGALRFRLYGVEPEDVGQMTGMFPGNAGGTRGAPRDDGPCPVNC